jgi:hypothetical protein
MATCITDGSLLCSPQGAAGEPIDTGAAQGNGVAEDAAGNAALGGEQTDSAMDPAGQDAQVGEHVEEPKETMMTGVEK